MTQNLKILRAYGMPITRSPFSLSLWWVVPSIAAFQLTVKFATGVVLNWIWAELIAMLIVFAAELIAFWRHNRYLQIVQSQIVQLEHQIAVGRTLKAQLEEQAKTADTWSDYATSTALGLANIPIWLGKFALGAAVSVAIGGEIGTLAGQTPMDLTTALESTKTGIEYASDTSWLDSSLPSTKLRRKAMIVHDSLVALEAQAALRGNLISKRQTWRSRFVWESVAIALITAPMVATISLWI